MDWIAPDRGRRVHDVLFKAISQTNGRGADHRKASRENQSGSHRWGDRKRRAGQTNLSLALIFTRQRVMREFVSQILKASGAIFVCLLLMSCGSERNNWLAGARQSHKWGYYSGFVEA